MKGKREAENNFNFNFKSEKLNELRSRVDAAFDEHGDEAWEKIKGIFTHPKRLLVAALAAVLLGRKKPAETEETETSEPAEVTTDETEKAETVEKTETEEAPETEPKKAATETEAPAEAEGETKTEEDE